MLKHDCMLDFSPSAITERQITFNKNSPSQPWQQLVQIFQTILL